MKNEQEILTVKTRWGNIITLTVPERKYCDTMKDYRSVSSSVLNEIRIFLIGCTDKVDDIKKGNDLLIDISNEKSGLIGRYQEFRLYHILKSYIANVPKSFLS